MNKHQDFFAKTQNKADFANGVIRTPHKSGSSTWIFVLILLLLSASGAVRYFGLHTHFQMPGIEEDLKERQERPYLIGEEIQIEGILKEDNSDLVSYTHTLTDSQGQKFFLKSKSIPLNNYSANLSGTIQILGKVEAFYQSTPIIEVQTIGTQSTQEIPENATGSEITEEVSNPGIYLAEAGLYFGHNFFENYVFLGQAGANNTIEIKNLENEKITKIRFFTCKNSGDNNCQDLTKAFKNISAKEITNEDGVSFFKDGEVKNRFFQNNNWRGYFINDAEDSEVEKLIPMIKVLNPEYIKDLVNHNGIKACLGTDNGLNSIYHHSISKTNEGLLITMEGKGEKNFTCQAFVDPSQSNNFKFVDLQTKTASETVTGTLTPEINTASKEEKTVEKADLNQEKPTAQITNQASGKDPSIKQFPIHSDKILTYTSSRGSYKMEFPSMNIAYEAGTEDTDLGEAGFRCKYSIKVIQYKNKDLIKSEPTLTIYECGNKKNLTTPKANYLIKEL